MLSDGDLGSHTKEFPLAPIEPVSGRLIVEPAARDRVVVGEKPPRYGDLLLLQLVRQWQWVAIGRVAVGYHYECTLLDIWMLAKHCQCLAHSGSHRSPAVHMRTQLIEQSAPSCFLFTPS